VEPPRFTTALLASVAMELNSLASPKRRSTENLVLLSCFARIFVVASRRLMVRLLRRRSSVSALPGIVRTLSENCASSYPFGGALRVKDFGKTT
jgi:hypothetical protein